MLACRFTANRSGPPLLSFALLEDVSASSGACRNSHSVGTQVLRISSWDVYKARQNQHSTSGLSYFARKPLNYNTFVRRSIQTLRGFKSNGSRGSLTRPYCDYFFSS